MCLFRQWGRRFKYIYGSYYEDQREERKEAKCDRDCKKEPNFVMHNLLSISVSSGEEKSVE